MKTDYVFSLFNCRVSCRLYLYPLTVLYSAGHVARRVVGVHAPFYFFFNGMLWTLFGMNLWWSYFIIYLIYRILTGKSRQVEDTRELSSDESDERKNGSVKSHIVTNGVGPTKGHHQGKLTYCSNKVVPTLKMIMSDPKKVLGDLEELTIPLKEVLHDFRNLLP